MQKSILPITLVVVAPPKARERFFEKVNCEDEWRRDRFESSALAAVRSAVGLWRPVRIRPAVHIPARTSLRMQDAIKSYDVVVQIECPLSAKSGPGRWRDRAVQMSHIVATK